jgi:molecular chaperone GrpE
MSQNVDIENEEIPDNSSVPQEENDNDQTQNEDISSSIEKLEIENQELKDKYLRLFAEFDNYRKRTNKEKIDIINSASAGVMKDMIPVMDDFERAIANNETAEDIVSVKEGFQLIFNKFKNTLESKGLKPMVAKGQAFDSELHEAIANIPAPSSKEKGKVIEDVEKGYYLNDKVIRYAKVVVGQ